MQQVHIPVELTLREIPQLNTAVAKEIKLEDNKELFFNLVKGSGNVSA